MGKPAHRSGYFAEDTIAAISSAVGGAIAIVRASGPGAFDLLQSLSNQALDHYPHRKLNRLKLEDLDDAMAVRFVAPESFTGEDMVEFHVHGNPFICSRLMEKLQSLGARQALPGEFSFRAVRNGKMTLAQAQGVADLIAAPNKPALELALETATAPLHHQLHNLAQTLSTLATLAEAGIDFSDQDLDEVSLEKLKQRLPGILEQLENLKATFHRGQLLQKGFRVALVGPPNAGKSTFFNALLGESRSIVTEHAGTTRDVVHEQLTLQNDKHSITLRLEDTAGLRDTAHPIEQLGIERSLDSVNKADLVLFISDDFCSSQEQWQALCQRADTNELLHKTLGILSKLDLTEALGDKDVREPFKLNRPWLRVSALTGEGMGLAVDAILEICATFARRGKDEFLLTRVNQLEAVTRGIECLLRSKNAPEIDLFAADLRQALEALSPLIGIIAPEDILHKIFAEFCIGK